MCWHARRLEGFGEGGGRRVHMKTYLCCCSTSENEKAGDKDDGDDGTLHACTATKGQVSGGARRRVTAAAAARLK